MSMHDFRGVIPYAKNIYIMKCTLRERHDKATVKIVKEN